MICIAGIVLAAAVSGTVAQMSSVSAQCQSAATGLLNGPASQCLAVAGLLTIGTTPKTESIVPNVDSWLSMSCPQPACSISIIDSAVQNITSGCSSEFQLTDAMAAGIQNHIDHSYSTGRQVACLKDTSANGAFCTTSFLKALENWTDSLLTLQALFDGSIANKIYLQSNNAPKSLTCTACIQAAYALMRPKFDSDHQRTWDNFLGQQCGSSFISSSFPLTIVQGANMNSPEQNSKNSALSLSSLSGFLRTGLLGIAGAAVLSR
ncbi:hypothetical protein FRC12_017403 [Ceratobasidium sp. 428]|nr:hypothetical protein FRC12_017403 [Ceratobasidium sp. 428]